MTVSAVYNEVGSYANTQLMRQRNFVGRERPTRTRNESRSRFSAEKRLRFLQKAEQKNSTLKHGEMQTAFYVWW